MELLNWMEGDCNSVVQYIHNFKAVVSLVSYESLFNCFSVFANLLMWMCVVLVDDTFSIVSFELHEYI